MTTPNHYFAQQATVNADQVPVAAATRPRRQTGRTTVGNFTGTWKSTTRNNYHAHLVNGDNEARCSGPGTSGPTVIWGRAPRSATRCSNCTNPAYCPDCGDTAKAGHGSACIYGGQR